MRYSLLLNYSETGGAQVSDDAMAEWQSDFA